MVAVKFHLFVCESNTKIADSRFGGRLYGPSVSYRFILYFFPSFLSYFFTRELKLRLRLSETYVYTRKRGQGRWSYDIAPVVRIYKRKRYVKFSQVNENRVTSKEDLNTRPSRVFKKRALLFPFLPTFLFVRR